MKFTPNHPTVAVTAPRPCAPGGWSRASQVRGFANFNERIEQRVSCLVFRENRRPSLDGGVQPTTTKHTNPVPHAITDERPVVTVRATPARTAITDDLTSWSTTIN